MLPQPRLRFLLADDPGAGKTIMAGLLYMQGYLLNRDEVCRLRRLHGKFLFTLSCMDPRQVRCASQLRRTFVCLSGSESYQESGMELLAKEKGTSKETQHFRGQPGQR
jgi:hypothetical protein